MEATLVDNRPRCEWHGELTAENFQKVAARLLEKARGKGFTVVECTGDAPWPLVSQHHQGLHMDECYWYLSFKDTEGRHWSFPYTTSAIKTHVRIFPERVEFSLSIERTNRIGHCVFIISA